MNLFNCYGNWMKVFLITGILCFMPVWDIGAQDYTPNLNFQLMEPGQTDAYDLYNDMLSVSDAFYFPILAAYPADASPVVNDATNGELFIVPADATGDWDGYENYLAQYINDSWNLYEPKAGWEVLYATSATSGVIVGATYGAKLVYGGESWDIPQRFQVDQLIVGEVAGTSLTNVSFPGKQLITYATSEVESGDSFTEIFSISGDSLYPFTNFKIATQQDHGTRLLLMGYEDLVDYSWFDINTHTRDVWLKNMSLSFEESTVLPEVQPATGEAKLHLTSDGDFVIIINHGGVTRSKTLADFSEL
jgi:hypothetical protein